MFYAQESATGKQTSLRTKDETEAKSLLNARNEAQRQPVLNLHLEDQIQFTDRLRSIVKVAKQASQIHDLAREIQMRHGWHHALSLVFARFP